jgi:hypothetical protein
MGEKIGGFVHRVGGEAGSGDEAVALMGQLGGIERVERAIDT